MRLRLLAAFIFVAGCGFEVSLGPGDGIRPIRFEEDVANPALKREGSVVFNAEVLVVSAADSARYYQRFGPDKIGAIRGVTLEILEISMDGVDLTRTAAPRVTFWGHAVQGRVGEEVELDDDQVDTLRAAILGGTDLRVPLVLTLDTPLEALDETRPELHIVIVVQPTLHVDVTRAI